MKTYLKYIVLLVVFLGFSVGLHWQTTPKKYSLESGSEISLKIDFAGVQPVFAASSNWEGVRDIAKFTKDIVKGIDSLLSQLATQAVLNQTTTVTSVSGNYTLRYTPNFNASVTSSALGAKTYKSSFEIWSGSGSSATKAMEIYFDSSVDKSSGSGVLAIWQPNRFDSTLNSANRQIECAMTGGSTNGTMICSWNGPIESAGTISGARIKVTANASAGTVSYKAIASPVVTTTCTGGNPDYYVLAFISKNVSPFYSIAKYGFNDNVIASTLCTTANSNNNAYFNINANPSATDSTKYFVADGITSDSNSSNTGSLYPTVSALDSLFNEMVTGTDTDMTVAKIVGLIVAFRSTAAP